MVGNCGATPPASKSRTRLGACVRWASMAAAQGTPVPTATVRPSSSARAAQQIISSMALNAAGTGIPLLRAVEQEFLAAQFLKSSQAPAMLQIRAEVAHAKQVLFDKLLVTVQLVLSL